MIDSKIPYGSISLLPHPLLPFEETQDNFKEQADVESEIVALQKYVSHRRQDIIKENSSRVFSEDFLAAFHAKDLQYLRTTGVICAKYGFDLSDISVAGVGKPLRVLQIGSGPMGDLYTDGPKMSAELTNLGASVLNMDIKKACKAYYSDETFLQKSWFDVDTISELFDVIFVDTMNPWNILHEISDQLREDMNSYMISTQLLLKTIHRLDPYDGLFFLSNVQPLKGQVGCFGFPENLPIYPHQYVYIEHPHVSSLTNGIQLYVPRSLERGVQSIFKG